jgi:hypothetical protein
MQFDQLKRRAFITLLGGADGTGLEQVEDEHSERVQDWKHRSNHAMILTHDANPSRMNFRKGQV